MSAARKKAKSKAKSSKSSKNKKIDANFHVSNYNIHDASQVDVSIMNSMMQTNSTNI